MVSGDRMAWANRMVACILLVAGMTLVSGCAGSGGNPRDPLEPMNRAFFKFNDRADRYVMKPVAKGYRAVTPQPVRSGVQNFFNNLGDASSTVNYTLQGKPEPAFYSFSRFTLNSTAGVLGFFDVTGETQRRFSSTGFGDTFARWGWKNSSYLVLPLLGPSTLRDGTGLAAGALFQNQVVFGNPHDDATLLASSVGAMSARERMLGLEDVLQDAALDPYSYVRDGWLQIRSEKVGDDPLQSSVDDINIDDLVD